jgi:hypothetical protein
VHCVTAAGAEDRAALEDSFGNTPRVGLAGVESAAAVSLSLSLLSLHHSSRMSKIAAE